MKYLFFVVLFALTSCDVGVFDYRFNVYNASNNTLLYEVKKDTTTNDWEEWFRNRPTYTYVKPGEAIGALCPDSTWETSLKYYFKDSTVYLFVFDSATFMKYRLDETVNFNKLYKRYDIKFEYLLKNNWKVTIQ